jgi:hypothetical protein
VHGAAFPASRDQRLDSGRFSPVDIALDKIDPLFGRNFMIAVVHFSKTLLPCTPFYFDMNHPPSGDSAGMLNSGKSVDALGGSRVSAGEAFPAGSRRSRLFGILS